MNNSSWNGIPQTIRNAPQINNDIVFTTIETARLSSDFFSLAFRENQKIFDSDYW